MIGVGSTVIVKFFTGPGQLLADGVTVNTLLIGAVPVFVAVKEAIVLPLPEALIPVVVLLFAHV